MEKQNKTNTVDRRALQTGIVSLIKIVEPNDKIEKNAKVMGNVNGKKVVALNIRKIVFEENSGYGRDIFYKLSKNKPYTYSVMDEFEESLNNTLVITHARNLSDVLFYAGFLDKVSVTDKKAIKKITMSKDQSLQIKKHQVKITSSGVINPGRSKEINSQAVSLDNFRKRKLPSRPQQIEKVYRKHFK